MGSTSHAMKYSKFTCSFEKTRNTYKEWSKLFNSPKNGPFAIMDIGCGSGQVLMEVLEPMFPENYSELVGIDIDPTMIEYCKNLKLDSRISFEQMDIATKKLPDKFKNRFNLLCSFFCLMYVTDLRRALRNSRDMLKLNGELLYLFLHRINPVWECYKDLSRQEEWKPYTQEFADFIPRYSGEDRELELQADFTESGLEIIKYEFQSDYSICTTRRNILNLFETMNSLYHRIPEDKKQNFRLDYVISLSNYVGVDFLKEESLEEEIEMFFPTVVVHARNTQTAK
ncbi:hypothetical protein HHI36_004565 [Cryptolaemus montrouzieri]|uniref:Methyltransferase domain-containing protein n=1 Tax=Cryptolaemus montrouzieri TaxID=559131 RepID=A0ABD2NRJ9_9CUCU